jgi:hypothetical protein
VAAHKTKNDYAKSKERQSDMAFQSGRASAGMRHCSIKEVIGTMGL